jgi:hypothetical protein
VEVTLPRFLFVREARYYFNNGRKMAEAGRLALQTFRSISFSKRIRRACPVQLPKVPALGLAPRLDRV